MGYSCGFNDLMGSNGIWLEASFKGIYPLDPFGYKKPLIPKSSIRTNIAYISWCCLESVIPRYSKSPCLFQNNHFCRASGWYGVTRCWNPAACQVRLHSVHLVQHAHIHSSVNHCGPRALEPLPTRHWLTHRGGRETGVAHFAHIPLVFEHPVTPWIGNLQAGHLKYRPLTSYAVRNYIENPN